MLEKANCQQNRNEEKIKRDRERGKTDTINIYIMVDNWTAVTSSFLICILNIVYLMSSHRSQLTSFEGCIHYHYTNY